MTNAEDYREDDLLPISGLQHLVFCERRAVLIFVDGVWADNVATIEGAHLHEKADTGQKTEARGDVRTARGVWLRSFELGLCGKADAIEFLRSGASTVDCSAGISLPGTAGTWIPVPVEYKRGRSRHEEGYEVQLCAQGMCLEEMLGARIPSGAIFYGRSHRRVNVTFSADLRARTLQASERLSEVLREGASPRFEPGPKCRGCSLMEECVPSILARSSARRYLAGIIALVEKELKCDGS